MASLGRRNSSRPQPLDKYQALEAQLLKVQRERNDLLNDVEALCISGDPGTIFDRSNLLGERLKDANREILVARNQARLAIEQAADVADDLEAARASKVVVVREAREAHARVVTLEKEVAFYQTQSASAMADRDAASWQAEEQRSRTASLQSDLHAAKAWAQQASEEAADLSAKLKKSNIQNQELSRQVQGLHVIPALKRDLASLRLSESSLLHQVAQLKDELHLATSDLEDRKRQLDEATRDRADLAEKLSSAGDQAVQDASRISLLAQQLQKSEATCDSVSALLKIRDSECKEFQRQAGVQATALAEARKALETATQQKVSALMLLSNAQASQVRSHDMRRTASTAMQQKDVGTKGAEDASAILDPAAASPPSPAKTPWRGWLSKAPSGAIGSNEALDHGSPNDVRTLRRQLSEARARSSAADGLAESVSHLRAALSAIATIASTALPEDTVQSRVEELYERVVTFRVGAVLGLSPEDSHTGDSTHDTDMLSALSDVSSTQSATSSPLSRELLDVLQAAVEALRALSARKNAREDC